MPGFLVNSHGLGQWMTSFPMNSYGLGPWTTQFLCEFIGFGAFVFAPDVLATSKKLVVDFPSSNVDLSSFQLPSLPLMPPGFGKVWHEGQWLRVPVAASQQHLPVVPQLPPDILALLAGGRLCELKDFPMAYYCCYYD